MIGQCFTAEHRRWREEGACLRLGPPYKSCENLFWFKDTVLCEVVLICLVGQMEKSFYKFSLHFDTVSWGHTFISCHNLRFGQICGLYSFKCRYGHVELLFVLWFLVLKGKPWAKCVNGMFPFPRGRTVTLILWAHCKLTTLSVTLRCPDWALWKKLGEAAATLPTLRGGTGASVMVRLKHFCYYCCSLVNHTF